jgi:Mannose-6-phosphate isomerase
MVERKNSQYIHAIDKFPYVSREPEPKRKVRLVISPYTTGEEGLLITHVEVPPDGISNGHIHNDSDEFIYFQNDGKVILDNEEYLIGRNSLVVAKRGVWHECINTSNVDGLTLLCIFVPPFKPFGIFPQLIEITKQYLTGKIQG